MDSRKNIEEPYDSAKLITSGAFKVFVQLQHNCSLFSLYRDLYIFILLLTMIYIGVHHSHMIWCSDPIESPYRYDRNKFYSIWREYNQEWQSTYENSWWRHQIVSFSVLLSFYLCGESTGHRWILHCKSEQLLNKDSIEQ